MDHVAILSTKLPWLKRILAGEKTIESRWYQHRRLPWQQIAVGDTVYFKNSGELVTVKAIVNNVAFYQLGAGITVVNLLDKYSNQLGLFAPERQAFELQIAGANYAIFIGLSYVEEIPAFAIDKTGFGAMAAWITVPDISRIVI